MYDRTGMRRLKAIYVGTVPGTRTRGVLRAGPLAFPVALGRGGILANKREGDGGTPRGTFRPVRLWWRADRLPRPVTRLPAPPVPPGRPLGGGPGGPPFKPGGQRPPRGAGGRAP